MSRKFLLGLFVLALLVGLFGLWERYRVEVANDGVELIMDYKALSSLEKEIKKEILLDLKERGISAVAIYPDTIKDLVNRGEIRLFWGNEIIRSYDITGQIDSLLASFPFSDNSVFIRIKDPSLVQRTLMFLPSWQEKYKIDYALKDGQIVIFFPKWQVKYLDLNLGFDEDLITGLNKAGLKVIPRINNNKLDNQINWSYLVELSPDYVIFSGNEITGYAKSFAENKIKKTAEVMKNNNIKFGMIEAYIAKQLGAGSLARELNYDLFKVHSIQQGEMDSKQVKYSMEKIVARYLRAVRERNVRLLYLKPFMQKKEGKDPGELTKDYIQLLTNELQKAGYRIGEPQIYEKYANSNIELLIISLGIIIAGVVLLEYLFGNNIFKYTWLFILVGAIGQFGLFYLGKWMMVRKILALASSIIFPSLAIISQLLVPKKKSNLLRRFLLASLISLFGVIFLCSSMAHISFSLKVDQFVGVKLSFILPLILISFYYLKILTDEKEINSLGYWQKRFSYFMNINLKVKHLFLILIFAVGGIFYIGRTGNYPSLPVPDLEIYFRDWLEKVLYVRPRFKEFIFGHPFLVLGLAFADKLKKKLVLYPIVILAAIGQINILNTFSHVHTPLLISLIRVFNGLWLGLINGFIFSVILGYILSHWLGRKAGKNV